MPPHRYSALQISHQTSISTPPVDIPSRRRSAPASWQGKKIRSNPKSPMIKQLAPLKKRVTTAAACLQCKKRKCRCDGSRPSCQSCINRGLICEFEVPEGRLQKDKIKVEYSALETEFDDLKALVAALTCSEGDMTIDLLARIRAGESIRVILQSLQPPSLANQFSFAMPTFSESDQSLPILANPQPFSPPPILPFEQGKASSVSSISESDKTKSHTPTQQPKLDLRTDLSAQLVRCGLSQYLETLVQNGFDTWDSILYIQESDLEALHVKLGNRRKLQRQIINFRNEATLRQSSTSTEDNLIQVSNIKPVLSRKYRASTSDTSLQRKYKRRPKPDVNAPQRPKTAYVSFSNYVRSNPEIATMSFDAIAKNVSHNWQSLGPDGKEIWENLAANEMFVYTNRLETYKQSEDYKKYQAYLETFKQKNQNVASICKGKVSAKERKASDKMEDIGSSETLSKSSENCQHALPQTDGAEYTNHSELRVASTFSSALSSRIHHLSPPLWHDCIDSNRQRSAERTIEINGMAMDTLDNNDAQFDNSSTIFTNSPIFSTDQSMDSISAYSQPSYTFQPVIIDCLLTQPFSASHDFLLYAPSGIGDDWASKEINRQDTLQIASDRGIQLGGHC